MFRSLSCSLVVLSLTTASLPAAQFAASVVSYAPGAGAFYNNAAAALGSPDDITGEAGDFGYFPNVLSPFSPAFESDELVQIGAGGHVTLQLSHYALVGSELELGVITNVSLFDTNYPGGTTTGGAALTFGEDDALVEVSEDGTHWVSLGSVLFNLPAVYYLNAGAYDTAAPGSPVLADFGAPFTGSLSDFDNLTDYSDILAVFGDSGGSGGGTWLDLSATGLAQVGFVRFSLDAGASNTFELDAVVIANSAVGAPVPEPVSLATLLAGASLVMLRRRTH